jgi:hypothetical protein
MNKLLPSLLLAALPVLASSVAIADDGRDRDDSRRDHSPLVEKVRDATAKYLDINRALADKYVAATPCVSGPNYGAMGVHFVRLDLLQDDGAVNAETPEALIYEPTADGRMRLVGVEFISLASNWSNGKVPVLDGHLLNYVGAPNRYGLPAFYEMHVWAWRDNSEGSFSDWNRRVSCEQQAAH